MLKGLSIVCLTQLLLCVIGNVYGVVPVNAGRDVSIILMVIHQFVAYALYVTPVFFMWEKLVRTHHSSYWIRLPSRIPVCKCPSPATCSAVCANKFFLSCIPLFAKHSHALLSVLVPLH